MVTTRSSSPAFKAKPPSPKKTSSPRSSPTSPRRGSPRPSKVQKKPSPKRSSPKKTEPKSPGSLKAVSKRTPPPSAKPRARDVLLPTLKEMRAAIPDEGIRISTFLRLFDYNHMSKATQKIFEQVVNKDVAIVKRVDRHDHLFRKKIETDYEKGVRKARQVYGDKISDRAWEFHTNKLRPEPVDEEVEPLPTLREIRAEIPSAGLRLTELIGKLHSKYSVDSDQLPELTDLIGKAAHLSKQFVTPRVISQIEEEEEEYEDVEDEEDIDELAGESPESTISRPHFHSKGSPSSQSPGSPPTPGPSRFTRNHKPPRIENVSRSLTSPYAVVGSGAAKSPTRTPSPKVSPTKTIKKSSPKGTPSKLSWQPQSHTRRPSTHPQSSPKTPPPSAFSPGHPRQIHRRSPVPQVSPVRRRTKKEMKRMKRQQKRSWAQMAEMGNTLAEVVERLRSLEMAVRT